MDGVSRREEAFQRRVAAAQLARDRAHEVSLSNGEEGRYRDRKTGQPSYTANFTKGLPHTSTGQIVDPSHYILFVRAIDSGKESDIKEIPLGPWRRKHGIPRWRSRFARGAAVRAWESMGAGLAFSLEGPDAQSVTIPPAPTLNSYELVAEMGEVYLMAILRDLPFSSWGSYKDCHPRILSAIEDLNGLQWFRHNKCCQLTPAERARKRGKVRLSNIFRGITPGVTVGPYISQFLVIGSAQLNERKGDAARNGLIRYGAISIDQRIPVATPGKDYMTDFKVFLDVQDGADLRRLETYEPERRYLATPRDLCTYVHYDALYEAYLNACLLLLNSRSPFDPGLPFQNPDYKDKQQAFAHFGGPHILSLVCEVATRALKAIRYQKFNVHRRLRPEAVGGLIDQHVKAAVHDKIIFEEVSFLASSLHPILSKVEEHNHKQNIYAKTCDCSRSKSKGDSDSSGVRSHGHYHGCVSYLLPMAFPEGSPMHPSYGAGHAVVAGACVTILKGFFDSNHEFPVAYEACRDGSHLDEVHLRHRLTVGGELNKLAENIAIGRGWAGVHYFTDYIESLRMGEKIAIGILEEQKLLFGENFYMSVEMFNGETIRI